MKLEGKRVRILSIRDLLRNDEFRESLIERLSHSEIKQK